MIAHIRAEAVRLRHTSSIAFPLVGLLIGILCVVFPLQANSAGISTENTVWLSLYAIGLSAPLMMLLGALPENRERGAHYAGLPARGIAQRPERLARLIGATAISIIFQVLTVVPLAIYNASAQDLAAIVAVNFLGSLCFIAVGAVVGRRFGAVTALLAGVAWVIASSTVNLSYWYLFPWNWPVAITFEPIGTNYNGTSLSPDNPVLGMPEVMRVGLCALLAVACWLLAVLISERKPQPKRSKRVTSTPVMAASALTAAFAPRAPRALPLRAVTRMWCGSGVIFCMVSTVLVLGYTAAFYPQHSAEVFTYAILPLGAGLAPVLTWRVAAPGMAQLKSENPRSGTAFVLANVLVLIIMVAVGGLLQLAADGNAGYALLWLLTGATMLGVSLTLTVRFGLAVALTATALWTVIGALIGGDILADTDMWLIGFPSWALSASGHAARLLIAVPVSAVLALLAVWSSVAILRRDAAVS